jgi:hydrogenase nickel incorporation protein HypB
MCETCGCGTPGTSGHFHHHEHRAGHSHAHEEGERIIRLEKDILYENNLLAARNRGFFEGKNILCLNLVSSPGSGKTTILEKTVDLLRNKYPVFIIEGDQQGNLDAVRLEKLGIPVKQINTGSGCHLDAHMVAHAIQELNPPAGSVVFIENIGNLVCPALFDLGEKSRILIMSVTEGDNKPVKYPYMFKSSHLCLINKTDLLPYVSFDLGRARKNALSVQPELQFIEISAQNGTGIDHWINWIVSEVDGLNR